MGAGSAVESLQYLFSFVGNQFGGHKAVEVLARQVGDQRVGQAAGIFQSGRPMLQALVKAQEQLVATEWAQHQIIAGNAP